MNFTYIAEAVDDEDEDIGDQIQYRQDVNIYKNCLDI